MDLQISDCLQLIVGISILSVWLLHAHVPTNFRVGQAQTLREEVTEAGLPDYVYDVMRIVKPIFALGLIKPFSIIFLDDVSKQQISFFEYS